MDTLLDIAAEEAEIAEESGKLLWQIDHPILGPYARVIAHSARKMLREGGINDLEHAEAVHTRLSELMHPPLDGRFSIAELFVLVSAAFLHDIGKPEARLAARDACGGMDHGAASARMIGEDCQLQMLFPCTPLQERIAAVVSVHDLEPKDIEKLAASDPLDNVPAQELQIPDRRVRPRLLAALLKLADELECSCDRTRWSRANDPRNVISDVRIRSAQRRVWYRFRAGAKTEDTKSCGDRMKGLLRMLAPYLEPFGLAYSYGLPEPSAKNQTKTGAVPPPDTFKKIGALLDAMARLRLTAVNESIAHFRRGGIQT